MPPPSVILTGEDVTRAVLTWLTNRVGPMETMFKCSADTKLTQTHRVNQAQPLPSQTAPGTASAILSAPGSPSVLRKEGATAWALAPASLFLTPPFLLT